MTKEQIEAIKTRLEQADHYQVGLRNDVVDLLMEVATLKRQTRRVIEQWDAACTDLRLAVDHAVELNEEAIGEG